MQQRLGYGVPERAQRVERKAVSDCGADVFWIGARMLGENGEPENTAEIRQGRKDSARDDLRRLRRKSGQGYFARGGVGRTTTTASMYNYTGFSGRQA